MTRKPLCPITVQLITVMPNPEYPGRLDLVTPYTRIVVPLSDVPALIAAMSTLAREMGADVPDPVPVIEGLFDALNDECLAQANYGDQPVEKSLSALLEAQAYLERTKK